MIAFSTSWNSGRHTDGQEMLDEILELGFDQVELGHGIRLSLLEGIEKVVTEGRVKITGLHNFCPLPVEVMRASPDCYKYSSHREQERKRATKLTLQTIDFAARFNAGYVVLHLGRVPIPDYTQKLIEMAEKGMLHSRQYVRAKIAAMQAREAKAEFYLQRVFDCLGPIVEYAAEKNIRLGVESRHGFEEIPSEDEIIEVLDALNAPHVGYWHDFGHVQIKENLGFLDHAEWLARIAPRLIGCHLHDVRWPGKDHRAPFTGDMEYDKLMAHIPKEMLLVFEMSPRRTAEEIQTAAERWKQRYGE